MILKFKKKKHLIFIQIVAIWVLIKSQYNYIIYNKLQFRQLVIYSIWKFKIVT